MPDEGYGTTDSSEPGSEGAAGDGVSEQLTSEDQLLDRGVDDLLDEGWNPPDREPSVHVPTQAEEREGESLDERLAEEEPDVDPDDPGYGMDDSYGAGDRRAGRLVDDESDGIHDVEKASVAEDVGIDGAAASAEEAAVHVIDESWPGA